MDREAPHVSAGLEEVSLRSLRNLSSAPLGGAEEKLGRREGGRVRLGAHACRQFWFSQDVTKGRRDYVGPGPLGLRWWFISFPHTCVMMSNSMTSVVIMRGGHESQN